MRTRRLRHPEVSPEWSAPPPRSPESARQDLARRRPETLFLLQLLIEDPGPDGQALMRRLAGQLRLCADIPELAAAAGCAPEAIDPGLMRAAAGLLTQAAQAAQGRATNA
jgi:hypothetical protein